MIKPEDFYQNTTRALSEIRDKIDENQKMTNSQIAALDKKIDVHIAVADTLDNQEEKKDDKSDRKTHFITTLIVGGGIGIMTIISSFFTQ